MLKQIKVSGQFLRIGLFVSRDTSEECKWMALSFKLLYRPPIFSLDNPFISQFKCQQICCRKINNYLVFTSKMLQNVWEVVFPKFKNLNCKHFSTFYNCYRYSYLFRTSLVIFHNINYNKLANSVYSRILNISDISLHDVIG